MVKNVVKRQCSRSVAAPVCLRSTALPREHFTLSHCSLADTQKSSPKLGGYKQRKSPEIDTNSRRNLVGRPTVKQMAIQTESPPF